MNTQTEMQFPNEQRQAPPAEALALSANSNIERRHLINTAAEARMVTGEDGEEYFEGYGIVFNQRSQMLYGWFVEVIAPEAVEAAMRADDIRVDAHHITHQILGRKKAGTASFEVDSKGVKYRAKNIKTTYSDDLAKNIRAGNIDGSSFEFIVAPEGEKWEKLTENGIEFWLRTITNFEITPAMGPVVNPAYLQTSANMESVAKRSLEAWKAAHPETHDTSLTPFRGQGGEPSNARSLNHIDVLRLIYG